ncbi:putative transposase, partial [Paenibacillus agaridevorans]
MSVADKQVVRQCLSLLPLQDFVAPFLDYRKQLKTVHLLKLFITAQLLNWDSLRTIESAIRSDEEFQAEFQVQSISKSQLSRRMNSLPVEITQA